MHKFFYLGLIILAVSAVGIADALLKKAAVSTEGLIGALKSPWTIIAILLYLFQIFFFTYVFEGEAKLSFVGILQTGLYALITLTVGILYFGESFTAIQATGIVLTIVGAVLLNL